MGNSLSPSLSDLFLDNLDNYIFHFNNLNKFSKMKARYRCMDDILAFIDGSPIDIKQILDEMNIIHPAITITLKIENNNSISILDLTIHRTENKFEFRSTENQSQTDHVIPTSSFHPFQHEMATRYCYTNRLLNICLTQISKRSSIFLNS